MLLCPTADRKPPHYLKSSVSWPIMFPCIQQWATETVINGHKCHSVRFFYCRISTELVSTVFSLFVCGCVSVAAQIQENRENREISVCRERRPGTLCPWQKTAGPLTPQRSQKSPRWGLLPGKYSSRTVGELGCSLGSHQLERCWTSGRFSLCFLKSMTGIKNMHFIKPTSPCSLYFRVYMLSSSETGGYCLFWDPQFVFLHNCVDHVYNSIINQ